MKLRWLGLMVFCGLLVAAEDSKETAAKKEMKLLQGTWAATGFENNGEKAPADDLKNYKLTIDGDKYTFKINDETASAGTMKVDPSAKPKTMDVTVTEGDSSGQTMLGIYELDGDNYKVAVAGPDKKRPTEFESKADSGILLITLKRAK